MKEFSSQNNEYAEHLVNEALRVEYENNPYGLAEMIVSMQDETIEAVSWAYQKLLAFGVQNTNLENALMMDRLLEIIKD